MLAIRKKKSASYIDNSKHIQFSFSFSILIPMSLRVVGNIKCWCTAFFTLHVFGNISRGIKKPVMSEKLIEFENVLFSM